MTVVGTKRLWRLGTVVPIIEATRTGEVTMMRFVLIGLTLGVLPSIVEAQTEIGLDAGAVFTRQSGETLTAFQIPSGWARVGFRAGDQVIIEPLATLTHLRSGGNSVTNLFLLPGASFLVGDGGAYLRGEVGLQWADSSSSDSESRFGFGGAVGLRRPIADAAALFRLEGGATYWPEKDTDPSFTQFRVVVGVSAIIN
jgi:hypothetical protein